MPPVIEVCILDGYGGGDCILSDGSKLYRSPSQMKNYWSTNQNDMKSFASWCYGTNPISTAFSMKELSMKIYE